MIIKQLRSGELDNFTYVVGCEQTKEAVVIDPRGGTDAVLRVAETEGLAIKTIFNTHDHHDHTEGNAELKSSTKAKIARHALASRDDASVDIKLEDGDVLEVGKIAFRVIHTPGHAPGGACLYAEGQLFTGDTLFVGDSGRTDLAGGHRPTLGASIREKLMVLPDDTVVWPGHDLGPTPSSTIGWEKRNNCNAREYGYYVEA